MPEVRADLTLDTSDALSAVSDLESAIDAATSGVTVDVDADTSAATTNIDTLEQSAEPIEVDVDADTSTATAAVGELAGASGEAADSMESVTSASAVMGEATSAASGDVSGLVERLGSISGASAAAVGGITGLAAATAIFFNEALDATAAGQRMDTTFGRVRSQIESINVGSLNMDLSELALTLGSDDDKLRQAASSFGQLGKAAGASTGDVARTTEEIIALSARAVALNPSLGDVGDVADRMGQALSRGGRFAAKLGVDISAAEINARALKDTGKATADELTFYEKAAAGAAIASQKYGDSLQKDVLTGAQNVQIVVARLKQTLVESIEAIGMPIVMPLLDAFESLVPLGEAVGRVIGNVVTGTLPALLAVVEGLVPVLTVFADVLAEIPAPVLAAALAFTTFKSPLAALFVVLGQLSPEMLTAAGAIAAVVVVVKVAAQAWKAFSTAMASNPIGAVLVGVSALAAAIGMASNKTEGLTVDVKELGRASDESLRKQAELIAQLQKTEGFGGGAITTAKETLDQLRTALEESFGAGKRFGQALVEAGAITEQQFNKALRQEREALDQANQTMREGESASQDYKTKIEEATRALVNQSTAALPSLSASISGFVADVRRGFGEEATVSIQSFATFLEEQATRTGNWVAGIGTLFDQGFGALAATVQQAGVDTGTAWLTELAGMDRGTLDQLNRMIGGSTQKMAQFQVLLGQYGLAAATAFVNGNFDRIPKETLAQMQQTVANVQSQDGAISGAMGQAGQKATEAFKTTFGATPQEVGRIMTEAVAAGMRHTGLMAEAGTALGSAFARSLGETAGLAQAAGQRLTMAGAAGTRNTGEWHAAGVAQVAGFANGIGAGTGMAVFAAGIMVGTAVGSIRNTGAWHEAGVAAAGGYANGISAGAWQAVNAARDLAVRAITAAKNAGSPTEHLWYDSAVSNVGAYAEGIERAGAEAIMVAQHVARDASTAMAATGSAVAVSVGGSGVTPAGTVGGAGGVTNVHVEGVTDPQAAAALVGRELAWQRRLVRR